MLCVSDLQPKCVRQGVGRFELETVGQHFWTGEAAVLHVGEDVIKAVGKSVPQSANRFFNFVVLSGPRRTPKKLEERRQAPRNPTGQGAFVVRFD